VALPSKYAKAVWETEGALATWLPDRSLQVGDIVTRDGTGGAIRVETRLRDLVRHEEPGPTVRRPGVERMLLQDGFSFQADADASAPGARVRARLSGASSFVFVAEHGTVTEYRRVADVREAMLSLYARGVWRDSWHVVTAVRSFDACTLVVAEGDDAEAELHVAAPGGPGGQQVIRAGAGVNVHRGRAATWSLTASTPLYEALHVKRRLRRTETAASYLDGDPDPRPLADGDETEPTAARVTPEALGLLAG
jgi:hypothetical protein